MMKKNSHVTREKHPESQEHTVASEGKTKRPSLSQLLELSPQSERKRLALWRNPLISYPGTLLLLAGSVWLTKVLEDVMHLAYPSSVWVLALILVALLWGVGPTIMMVIVGVVVLDIYLIPPVGDVSLIVWPDVVQLMPYAVAGIAVAVITTQLDRNRMQAQQTRHDLALYTREIERINTQLEDTNQKLEDTNQKLEDTNQQLERESRTKDYFLSVATHELKTPVTGIRGQAQLFQRRLQKNKPETVETKDVLPVLSKIDELTLRLTNLINELLDIGRIQRGQVELQKERGDIGQLCCQVVEEQRVISGREIELHVPPEPVEVMVDQEQIRSVLTNLVGNAVKYSPKECPIEMWVERDAPFVCIRVRDYGQGIAEEDLSQIFEAFYRTNEASQSGVSGLGLGLAIVKNIVELHQGRISVQSEVGKGSTFFVDLPLWSAHQIRVG